LNTPSRRDILAMTRVFASDEPNEHLLATKGAPEAVADLCHLDAARARRHRRQVLAMAERGLRVLGVARGRWQGAAPAPGQSPPWPQASTTSTLSFSAWWPWPTRRAPRCPPRWPNAAPPVCA
jgi:magnesium-transporting ATPase (P-type)